MTIGWTYEVSSGPLVSTPLIADVDLDGDLDIAVASFAGEVDVIRSKDGQRIAGSLWPYRLVQGSFFASPLQVCIACWL